jgi:catechol 2,3-dioxygenase-like lactoylglutathione lyase family enzyme
VGIVVNEISRSREFYEAIGFKSEGSASDESGSALSKILDVEDVKILTEKFTLNVSPEKSIWREEGFRLELVQYTTTKLDDVTTETKLANNVIGKVHICFTVDDIGSVLNALKALKFKVPDAAHFHRGSLMTYLRDPNGVSIELIELKKSE